MTSDGEFTIPKSSDQDVLLEGLVKLTNATGAGVHVSLQMGGLIVYGRLCSNVDYYRALSAELAEYTAEDTGAGILRDNIAAGFAKRADALEAERSAGREAPTPRYVHLQDVVVWGGGTEDITGSLWRGRIAAVDGIVIGTRGP